MKVVGICGGVGSGKSVVVRLLHQLYGMPYFDSDTQAKALYYDEALRREMIQTFALDPIDADGQLKKAELRQLLTKPDSKEHVERLIHDALRAKWQRWRAEREAEGVHVVVLESAILFTSGYYRLCDTVLAVESDRETRRRRVEQRDREIATGHFERIEALQEEEAKECRMRADACIHNSEGLSVVHQVEKWYSTLGV